VLPLKSHNWRKIHFESRKLLLKRILPLIVATIDDRSGVSGCSGSQAANAIQAYDPLPNGGLVGSSLEKLQDPEAEVRTAATFNFAHVAKCIHGPVLQVRQPQDGDDEAVAGPRVGGGTLGAR
jgi:hypothetical protein